MTRQEAAETLALQALTWILGNDDLLPVFLNASGASTSDLAQGAADPAFLASVLDFLLLDDAWVIGFCDANGQRYEAPMQARAFLSGGEAMNWT
ncbi:MAG: DUF3572 domain-containing protein [Pseudorhodobacter sp.]|nr:DUF3572 domain-containing protein [Pseudorhodobacter sp.]